MNKVYRIHTADHRVEIDGLPAGLDGLRIVHIGDLHIPKSMAFVRQTNRMLHELNPDLLLSTGDLVDHPHWLSAARRYLPVLLDGLHPALGIYGTLGNHDNLAVAAVQKELGINLLLNRCVQVGRNDQTLNVCGVYTPRGGDNVAAARKLGAAAAGGRAEHCAGTPAVNDMAPASRAGEPAAGWPHARGPVAVLAMGLRMDARRFAEAHGMGLA